MSRSTSELTESSSSSSSSSSLPTREELGEVAREADGVGGAEMGRG